MTAVVVVAVGGLVIGPLARHQQTPLAQQVEQGIAAQTRAGRLPLRMQEMVQLAGPQPGLADAHPLDGRHHLVGLHLPRLLALQARVVRLTADSPMTASPQHAQAFDALFLEDLPKGFFTTRTP